MPSHSLFALFTLLPAELRLQVWQLSCHPRVVEVSYDPEEDRYTTTAPVPAVLQACHESRCESLRMYIRCFGTTSHEPRIYFYREMDTLYIPRPPFMGYDDSSRSFAELIRESDYIANLAIDYVPPSVKRPWETYNKYVLMQSFPKVHEVFLVTDITTEPDNDHHLGDELDLADPKYDALSLDRLLEDVIASFYYEIQGQFFMSEREKTIEPLHLPHFVLKSKTWTHRQDESQPISTICAA
ncbi:hypothetical protein SAMD00023353_0801390 [Rosellinia necatrix]|uniref:2EXR domain-containing protein n=1 Tax=Rosellinia necatrix TaxID=77044 RepID=A0A1W2TB16_ROSNE|nr:hypothetical protein SAMD00023353_0801390 [Rosellinia necatrix]